MIKHVILILMASTIAIVFSKQLNHILIGLHYIQASGALRLYKVLSHYLPLSFSVYSTFTMTVIPIVVGCFLAGIYWLFSQKKISSIGYIMWFVWLILATVYIVRIG